MSNGDNVRIVRKHLISDWVDEVTFSVAEPRAQGVRAGVPGKVELDEVLLAQRCAVDRILAGVLVEPGANDLDVEYRAVGGADRVLEGLETGGAKVEGQATERS